MNKYRYLLWIVAPLSVLCLLFAINSLSFYLLAQPYAIHQLLNTQLHASVTSQNYQRRLWPYPNITVHDFENGDAHATILQIYFARWPLVTGHLRIAKIVADHAKWDINHGTSPAWLHDLQQLQWKDTVVILNHSYLQHYHFDQLNLKQVNSHHWKLNGVLTKWGDLGSIRFTSYLQIKKHTWLLNGFHLNAQLVVPFTAKTSIPINITGHAELMPYWPYNFNSELFANSGNIFAYLKWQRHDHHNHYIFSSKPFMLYQFIKHNKISWPWLAHNKSPQLSVKLIGDDQQWHMAANVNGQPLQITSTPITGNIYFIKQQINIKTPQLDLDSFVNGNWLKQHLDTILSYVNHYATLGNIHIQDLYFLQAHLQDFQLHLQITDHNIYASPLNFICHQAAFSNIVSITDFSHRPTLHADFKIYHYYDQHGFNFIPLTRGIIDFSGTAFSHGQTLPKLFNKLNITGQLHITDGTLSYNLHDLLAKQSSLTIPQRNLNHLKNPITFDTLSGDVSFNNDTLSLNNAAIKSPYFNLQLTGAINVNTTNLQATLTLPTLLDTHTLIQQAYPIIINGATPQPQYSFNTVQLKNDLQHMNDNQTTSALLNAKYHLDPHQPLLLDTNNHGN